MTEKKESQTSSYGVIKTALQILGSGVERDVFYRSVNPPLAEDKEDGTEFKWEPVTNLEAKAYIECAAKKWRDEFGKRGLVDGDVVAIWVTGRKFEDLVNIYSIMAAGYVPQLFSSVFQKTDIVWDLFQQSNSRAILYDPEYAPLVESPRAGSITKIQILSVSDLQTLSKVGDDDPFQVPEKQWSDVVFIAHSSGTTGNAPKLIPCTYGYLHNFVNEKFPACVLQGEKKKATNVMNTFGNLAKIATVCLTVAAMTNNVKVVQSSSKILSPEEIMLMIRNYNLNRGLYVGSTLSAHIRRAQTDQEVFDALYSCDQLVYSGVALPKDDELWAREKGLKVTSSYGSSETAMVMTSVTGSSPTSMLHRMIPGLSLSLRPYPDYPNLVELVVKGGEIDSPHPSLLAQNGIYHTKDLFEEVEPGLYGYRGRANDFVKTANGFCDANTIEEAVKTNCKDFVKEALVLGSGRPVPILFVEISQNNDLSHEEIKGRILKALAEYNTRVYRHEEISSMAQIHLLEEHAIPRTEDKGNPKRNAAEEMFKQVMDDIFADPALSYLKAKVGSDNAP